MKLLLRKPGLLVIAGIALCLLSCKAKRSSNAGVAGKLLALEREAIKREFQNDTAYLSSIMDSTFIELSDGRIKRKHDVLKTIYYNNIRNRSEGITLDSFVLEEPVVHVYDGAAVVSFIMHTFRKQEGARFEGRTRFYDVWVKRGLEWKAVTWQASPVEE